MTVFFGVTRDPVEHIGVEIGWYQIYSQMVTYMDYFALTNIYPVNLRFFVLRFFDVTFVGAFLVTGSPCQGIDIGRQFLPQNAIFDLRLRENHKSCDIAFLNLKLDVIDILAN